MRSADVSDWRILKRIEGTVISDYNDITTPDVEISTQVHAKAIAEIAHSLRTHLMREYSFGISMVQLMKRMRVEALRYLLDTNQIQGCEDTIVEIMAVISEYGDPFDNNNFQKVLEEKLNKAALS